MRHETQQFLIDRVLSHASASTTDFSATESEIPAERYFSPSHFERERREIFEKFPIAAALSAMVPKPGDFLALEAFNLPLLLSRGKDGALHAHVNACRHRGTKLVSQPRGSAAVFSCPYHGWSYGTDGKLLGIPHERCFASEKKEDLGLIPLPVQERSGIVWILLRPGERMEERAMPMALIEELGEELDALDLAHHRVFRSYARPWRGNWKIFADGALESYHFRVVHRRSIYPLFFDNLLVVDRLGHHQRLVLPKKTILDLAQAERARWDLRPHANLVYFLFPSTVLLVQSDHVVLISLLPVSVSDTGIAVTMLVPESPASKKSEAYWEKNYRITLEALDEDFSIGEKVFEGLRSGAVPRLLFGRNEIGIANFHENLAARLP